MSDGPRAPSPAPPGAPRPPPTDDHLPGRPVPEDDDDGALDDVDLDDGDELFGREWPDDEDEPADVLASEPAEVEEHLDVALDDEPAEVGEPSVGGVDELEDLAAADDTDIPIIDPDVVVRLDGRPLPGRVDWARASTTWVRPAGGGVDRDVTLELAGRRLQVTVCVVAGDQECVLLGRDLLKGRFLLRA